MPIDDNQSDLFSDLDDFDLVRHLLADLHDDLTGKVARSRQLLDLSQTLGSSGTMLFGGETAFAAWREARWSFIHGHFVATVLLCQGLAENLLASFLTASLPITDFPKRVAFAETLLRCLERGVITKDDASDLRRLMALRNPLSHFRDLDDDTNLSRRVLSTMMPAIEHLRSDATFAIGLAIRVLSLPAFRLGR
jgi:hypothetical protein